MFRGVSHIYYRVRDVEESIEFYTKNLGFTLLRKYLTNGRLSAYVELDGVLLEFGVPADLSELPGERTIRRIGIAVDDMDAALADLTSKGVEVVREPWDATTFWGRQAVIRDPSGYEVSLREWSAPDGPTFEGWTPRHETVERLA